MRNLYRPLSGIFIFSLIMTEALCQEMPVRPISYRIFSPFILNPAIAGNKDFSTLEMLFGSYGNSYSGLVSGNLRISKTNREYTLSEPTNKFTGFGAGAFLFNEKDDNSTNTGAGLSFSYHLQADKDALSFLSFGVTVKGIANQYSGNPDLNKPAENTIFPEVDAGIYYYTPSFYAGISATNLLGNPLKPDSLGNYTIPLSRQYFLLVGYKFLIDRGKGILIEPSLIISTNGTFSGNISNIFKPGIKLYSGNFCAGTYFDDFSKVSVFFQYKYSRMYFGTYFEYPYKESFFKDPLFAEFSIGFNLSSFKARISRQNHW
jgi:type IX secretion system PorP/SprF family membrane protein